MVRDFLRLVTGLSVAQVGRRIRQYLATAECATCVPRTAGFRSFGCTPERTKETSILDSDAWRLGWESLHEPTPALA